MQGYVQNAFTTLAVESDDHDAGVWTVITQMAVLTTQSQLMASTAAETSALVTMAINQLAVNQQAMQQQFATFASRRNTTYQPVTPTPPPMQKFNIPNCGTFQPAGRGVGGRCGGRGRGKRANAGRQGRTPFANFMGRGGQGGYPPLEAMLRRLRNKMRHVMRRRCIPTSSKGTRTGTFVSFAVLMSKMDIHPKHAQPPGDAQITKRDTLVLTWGSILRLDMTRAPRQCTSHS